MSEPTQTSINQQVGKEAVLEDLPQVDFGTLKFIEEKQEENGESTYIFDVDETFIKRVQEILGIKRLPTEDELSLFLEKVIYNMDNVQKLDALRKAAAVVPDNIITISGNAGN